MINFKEVKTPPQQLLHLLFFFLPIALTLSCTNTFILPIARTLSCTKHILNEDKVHHSPPGPTGSSMQIQVTPEQINYLGFQVAPVQIDYLPDENADKDTVWSFDEIVDHQQLVT